jgi:hypothetical protein
MKTTGRGATAMGSAAAARSHKLINWAKDWVKQQPYPTARVLSWECWRSRSYSTALTTSPVSTRDHFEGRPAHRQLGLPAAFKFSGHIEN